MEALGKDERVDYGNVFVPFPSGCALPIDLPSTPQLIPDRLPAPAPAGAAVLAFCPSAFNNRFTIASLPFHSDELNYRCFTMF